MRRRTTWNGGDLLDRLYQAGNVDVHASLGPVGHPIAVCHLGGLLGGILAYEAAACWRVILDAKSRKALSLKIRALARAGIAA